MTWFPVEDKKVTSVVRKFILERPEFITKETTRVKFYDTVTENLKYCLETAVVSLPGVMTQDAFFNFQTLEAQPPSPGQFCFNYIDHPFDVCRKMDVEIVAFLSSLCTHDWLQLHVLRLFVKSALLNDNPSQMILFLIGPGQTGKSTFAKMLMSLKENTCCTLELPDLSERFGMANLLGSDFAVFPDVDPHGLTSKRASPLESMSSGEDLVIYGEYLPTVNYRYKGNILMHGNSDFEVPEKTFKDSTGAARRFCQVSLQHRCKESGLYLEERFAQNRIQFIWWALTCPLPCDYWLGKVPALSDLLDGDVEDDIKAFAINILLLSSDPSRSQGNTA